MIDSSSSKAATSRLRIHHVKSMSVPHDILIHPIMTPAFCAKLVEVLNKMARITWELENKDQGTGRGVHSFRRRNTHRFLHGQSGGGGERQFVRQRVRR